MDKKLLNKKLKEQVNLLKTQSKDAKFADSTIKELLSLKGQIDRVKDMPKVVSEIKGDNFRITKYETETIEFHINGYNVTIEPTLNLWETPFNLLLTIHDNWDKLNDEDKETYNILLSNTILYMQTATFVFTYPQLLSKLMKVIIEHLNNEVDNAENEDNLPKDDKIANEEFREVEMFKEKIKKEL